MADAVSEFIFFKFSSICVRESVSEFMSKQAGVGVSIFALLLNY